LGDLLLRVYHARMAEERQAFAFADVSRRSRTKMIRPPACVRFARKSAPLEPHPASGSAPRPQRRQPARMLDCSMVYRSASGSDARDQVAEQAASRFRLPSLTPVWRSSKRKLAELEEADSVKPERRRRPARDLRRSSAISCSSRQRRRHLKIDPESALRAANENSSAASVSSRRSSASGAQPGAVKPREMTRCGTLLDQRPFDLGRRSRRK